MKEVMTYAEICSQFDSEWVLVENPKLTKNQEVKSGRVLCHSKDRDEVDRKALKLRPRHSAILFIGSIPEGMEVVL